MIRESDQKYFITTTDPEGTRYLLLKDLTLKEFNDCDMNIILNNVFEAYDAYGYGGKSVIEKTKNKKYYYEYDIDYDYHDCKTFKTKQFTPEFHIHPIEITIEYFDVD